MLDDPLGDLGAKAPLLELVSRASLEQQIIYLTQDDEVASWARVESMTGALAIFEPSVEHHDTTKAPSPDGKTTPDGSHVAA
ncbi:hypothetical protein B7486_71105 [cyanobacterium TDX16]|nr:hypothetical protein B7486_71105 [cyanobacterium TDX16]